MKKCIILGVIIASTTINASGQNRCGISITYPNLRGMDSTTWCDPYISNWRPSGGSHPDQQFTVKGTTINPPTNGFITLSLFVDNDKEYDQPGKFQINSDGTWSGRLYLKTTDKKSVSKTIIVRVNNSEGEIKRCEFYIGSCN